MSKAVSDPELRPKRFLQSVALRNDIDGDGAGGRAGWRCRIKIVVRDLGCLSLIIKTAVPLFDFGIIQHLQSWVLNKHQ